MVDEAIERTARPAPDAEPNHAAGTPALIDLGELADRVRMDREWTGERELAAALQEAAQVAG
jgi:hypothetical protein